LSALELLDALAGLAAPSEELAVLLTEDPFGEAELGDPPPGLRP
jgi:hypothetical protein